MNSEALADQAARITLYKNIANALGWELRPNLSGSPSAALVPIEHPLNQKTFVFFTLDDACAFLNKASKTCPKNVPGFRSNV